MFTSHTLQAKHQRSVLAESICSWPVVKVRLLKQIGNAINTTGLAGFWNSLELPDEEMFLELSSLCRRVSKRTIGP